MSFELNGMSLADKTLFLEHRLKKIEELFGGMRYDMRRVVQSEMKEHLTPATQAETMHGMYTALCIETVDVWKQNRIRFYCPLLHDPTKPIRSLPWAYPVSPFGGIDDSGCNWVPPAGSTICLLFEGGVRNAPYYIGTAWGRNRGPSGDHVWNMNVDEYYQTFAGHRGGYLVGPNDESQVLPPWNTESYNGFDLNSIADFANNPEAQKRITIPNIYGFKTPEKHMLKMVDGDPRCNRRWKRIELMSGCGNWLMMKDDHLHFAGQWAHPSCGAQGSPGDVSCISGVTEETEADDITRVLASTNTTPDLDNDDLPAGPDIADAVSDFGSTKEKVSCQGKKSNSNIIGGHPRTPSPQQLGAGIDGGQDSTLYMDSQVGSNPYFKHANECRPYIGPGTPCNNRIDLPQSGIQLMSCSGHTIVFDDSVEEPRGAPEWERSTMPFDYGCNDKFLGRLYIKSHAGKMLLFNDMEEKPRLPGENNCIRLKSQTGSLIELNDHTQDEEKDADGNCVKFIAGARRGVHIQSSSRHKIQLCDHENEQSCVPRCGNIQPINKAKKAYVMIRTGYGMHIMMNDSTDQQKTTEQYTQIFCPQKDNRDAGPHMLHFQEVPSGPGQVFLRTGGYYIISTRNEMVTYVGDPERMPADKANFVSRNYIEYAKEGYMNIADSHLFFAKKQIALLAGMDCPNSDGEPNQGPCPAQVVVYFNGRLRISDRVIASCSQDATTANIFMLDPLASMAQAAANNNEGEGGT